MIESNTPEQENSCNEPNHNPKGCYVCQQKQEHERIYKENVMQFRKENKRPRIKRSSTPPVLVGSSDLNKLI
jgi:hypothetical protein